MTARALDTVADRLILPGYSRLGYALRARSWPALPPGAMTGRTALVTGANSGIGAATAAGLAELGASVHLLGRDPERGAAVAARIRELTPDAHARVETCDLSRLTQVREFGARFAAEHPTLDVLVHNAGVLTEHRQLTEDGNELTLATHVLGPFLLTRLLREPLRAAPGGRVVWVSSAGMYPQPLRPDNLQSDHGEFGGTAAYAHAKRMQVTLAGLLADQLLDDGISVTSMHPGWVDTPGLRTSLPTFHRLLRPVLRTPEQGADTIVWLAAAPDPMGRSGSFFHDRRPRPTHYLRRTRAADTDARRRALWDAVVALTELDADSQRPAG